MTIVAQICVDLLAAGFRRRIKRERNLKVAATISKFRAFVVLKMVLTEKVNNDD